MPLPVIPNDVPDEPGPSRISRVSYRNVISAINGALDSLRRKVSVPEPPIGEVGVVEPTYEPGDARRYGIETDANAAIKSMRDTFLNSSRIDSLSGNRVGDILLTLPPGRFVITDPGAFLAGAIPSDGRRLRGITIQGAGRHATEIVFSPTEAGYLFDNQDRVSRITLRDITFTGTSANASFMNSVSNGGPQALICERVVWQGTWTRGFTLTGNDVNSEFIFYGCRQLGTWETFLWCDNVQALNHHFIACDMEPDAGDVLNYVQGGHVNIIGGSWIGPKNSASGGTGTFIKLSGTGGGQGINRLYVEGVRTEYRSTAYKFIDSSWRGGTITFKSTHDTGWPGATADLKGVIRHRYDFGGDSIGLAPVISYEGCRLSGSHEYVMSGSNDLQSRTVTYRDTLIDHHVNLGDFIVTTRTGAAASRIGAAMPVRFESCRSGNALSSSDQGRHVFDQTVNGTTARNAVLRRRLVSIKTGFGDMPTSGTSLTNVFLPIGAVVTSVRAVAPAGSSSGTATTWAYTVQTAETTPTVLFSKGGADTGAGQTAGYNLLTEPFFICDSDAKRQLVLTANATTSASGTKALMLVEYLA